MLSPQIFVRMQCKRIALFTNNQREQNGLSGQYRGTLNALTYSTFTRCYTELILVLWDKENIASKVLSIFVWCRFFNNKHHKLPQLYTYVIRSEKQNKTNAVS